MQDSMYSALFGALSNEHRMALISNNLANVNTTGYKQDQLSFEDTFIRFAHDIIMEPVATVRSEKLFPEPIHIAKPRLSVAKTDFSQGSLVDTGSPLDVAISGDGFFKVRTPQGDFLTRNGHFHKTSEGLLVNAEGFPVLGVNGEITLPQGNNVMINEGGEIFVDGAQVDQFQVVSVEDKMNLEKLGSNMYRVRNGADAPEIPAENAKVSQSYLEQANVNVVEEMVNMIEVHRAYEMYTKTITQTQETDLKAINQVGRAK